jgi:tetratricopeptide (TPR) repeat protein
MMRSDWLMRLIEQLGEFVRKVAGLVEKGKYAEALDVSSRAWSDLLDVPREVVDRVDTPTLAQLLRDPAKQRAAAKLLVAEARAYEGKGDPLHAATCYRRAYELHLEARAQDPTDEDMVAILELSRHVPAGEVDPHYRSKV